MLPLARAPRGEAALTTTDLTFRDPLTTPRPDEPEKAREIEAAQLVAGRAIVGRWTIRDRPRGRDAARRAARHHDPHAAAHALAVYERAPRNAGIPFVTSRQGGLLDTLEAKDI